jgi:hypothetical protein
MAKRFIPHIVPYQTRAKKCLFPMFGTEEDADLLTAEDSSKGRFPRVGRHFDQSTELTGKCLL